MFIYTNILCIHSLMKFFGLFLPVCLLLANCFAWSSTFSIQFLANWVLCWCPSFLLLLLLLQFLLCSCNFLFSLPRIKQRNICDAKLLMTTTCRCCWYGTIRYDTILYHSTTPTKRILNIMLTFMFDITAIAVSVAVANIALLFQWVSFNLTVWRFYFDIGVCVCVFFLLISMNTCVLFQKV